MVKIGITARLFLSLLIVSMLTAVGVGLGTRWSFKRGFQGYLNEVEARRMEAMAFEFSRAYQEHGNWDFIRNNREAWERYTGAIGRERATSPRPGGDSIYYAVPDKAPRRLGLYDQQGNHLAGNLQTGDDLRYQPVLVDGKMVGTLAGAPLRGLQEEAELTFQAQQQRDSLFIGLGTLVLAALAAMLLARSFVAPTRRLIAAASKVAAGDYGVRVPHAQRDELGTLARNFNIMVATLESNEALRRHFMADISHELRTPLSVLQAQLEAMEDGIEPIDASSLKALMDEVTTLSRLVDDMRQITLSEVGAFDYRREPLDLAALLHSEIQKWSEPLAQAGMEIVLDSPAAMPVQGDTVRLRQLLRNLFNNTLRHAEGATQLSISLHVMRSQAVLILADNGPGVSDAGLPMLFERFWRGDRARSRTTGGSGLGLAICRSIVEAHSGSISAMHTHTAMPRGLTIRITLPLSGEAA
ncbi:HAMP domain-containing protein [Pseudoduganella sp. FT25W]|uniref:histidine kinase n=1 Tax=Duganella alba TaxID=2666081 RepID=A0A6L5QAU3_9BURK|nr:ATP-binding protein [Duganella alba]MRX06855.1 HAMP domain-containing protein [Duganella alba]MRX16248.1 HAMP domain-containing protein [Duganella alba]